MINLDLLGSSLQSIIVEKKPPTSTGKWNYLHSTDMQDIFYSHLAAALL